MPYQTAYNERLALGLEGHIAKSERAIVISRTIETAAMGFGKVAVQGVGDLSVRPSAVGQTRFVGITVLDQAAEASVSNGQPIGATAGVMRGGDIWVVAGEAVAAGDQAYFVPATGALVKTAAGNIIIPSGRFDTSAALGGLALLYIA